MNISELLPILRDSTWQFAGVVISVIALVIAAVSLANQLSRKSLFVTVAGYQSLVDPVLSGSENELSVTFNGKPISKLNMLTLHFSNNGNIPISTEDFETPIEISFKSSPTILRVRVSRAIPLHLPLHTRIENEILTIAPLLLNPKDEFTIEILLENMQDRTPYDIEPLIRSRIRGLQSVDFTSSYVPVLGIRTPIIGIEIYPATIAVTAIVVAVIYLFRVLA